jgi:uncharacterized protein with FMN-binding domain
MDKVKGVYKDNAQAHATAILLNSTIKQHSLNQYKILYYLAEMYI